MNFFKRRAILKKANYLDLTPLRLIGEEIDANNIVTILIPKFKSNFARTYFLPRSKSPYIKVKLDALGSASWLAIDGKKNVAAIVETLNVKFAGTIQEPTERLIKFLTLLYTQQLITFVELIG